MEGLVGHLGLPSTDEDSAYDSPRSTETSLSPTTPPRGGRMNILSCCQCGDSLREPRPLPCLHSLCKACLPLRGKKIICPECLSEYPLPNTIEPPPLPLDPIIKGKLFCGSCKNDPLEAVKKCLDCDMYLCTDCTAAHIYLPCYPGHKLVDLAKNRDMDFLGEVICAIHPTESLKYFCYPCNELMCQICADESHAQSNHFFEEIRLIGEAVITSLSDKANRLKARIQEWDKATTQSTLYLHGQFNDISKKLNQVYEHHLTQLHKYKEQQSALLEAAYYHMINAFRTSSKMNNETAVRLNRLADFILYLTNSKNTLQCLKYKKLFESELTNISGLKQPVCRLKFESSDTDTLPDLIKSFGRVIYEINETTNETPDTLYPQAVFPYKYDKWSNSCFDDVRAFSELHISDENRQNSRPFHLKSSIPRTTITYSWKFGMYGTLQSQFTEPNGVCINNEGDIIIADTNNNRVQVFDRVGKFKFSFGDGTNGDNGTLLFPNRVAVMEKSGDIVVTERSPTHQVQVYNQYGQFIRKFGANILQHPRAVAVDKDGYIIVVECKVMRVIIFDMLGNVKTRFSCDDILHFPNGVAVNDKQEIFISDNRTHCVVVYNYQGKQLRTIGQEGLTNYPIGVMLNKAGNVVVADNHNNFNLTAFTQEGQFVSALESKVKHAQCYDAAIAPDGTVALTSKDYRVYVYLTSF